MEMVNSKSMRIWLPPGDAASDHFFDILDRYSEPHRHYHNELHARWVSTWCYWLGGKVSMPMPEAVMLAALFHDAIYDPRSSKNERNSADLAVRELRQLGVEQTVIDEVERLVMLTKTHDPRADDVNGIVLCDADLAVLGSSRPSYQYYAAGIRAEYSHLSDYEWRYGRSVMLTDFLSRMRLYNTEDMYEVCEEQARSNLAWELRSLHAAA